MRYKRSLAIRLRDALFFSGAILAVFLVTGWLFGDGQGGAFGFFGTIFAFWVGYCVALPTIRARRLKTQR